MNLLLALLCLLALFGVLGAPLPYRLGPLLPLFPFDSRNHPAPAQPPQPHLGWAVYRDDEHGFEIKYPDGWYIKRKDLVREQYRESTYLFGRGSQPEEVPPLTHPWPDLSITIHSTPCGHQELERVSSPGDWRGEQPTDGIRYEITELAGMRANRRTSAGQTTLDFPSTQIIFAVGGTCWSIHHPNIDHDGAHAPIYDQILATLKLLEH